MRVDVTRWNRRIDANKQSVFEAVTLRTYLNAEEVTRCALHRYTEAEQAGWFALRFDVRHLHEDAIAPMRLLAAEVVAEVRRQEEAKTQAEESTAIANVLVRQPESGKQERP